MNDKRKFADEVRNRIGHLREYMKENGVQAVIVPSTDPHGSEYVPDHWKLREWISGFNGSAGTAVITLNEAALWTDSRYFLQAEDQLEGTGILLMKEKLPETPTITDWLGSVLKKDDAVGIDPTVNSHEQAETWANELMEKYDISFTHIPTTWWDELWPLRPLLPYEEVEVQPLPLAGESCADKLTRIRKEIGKKTLVVSALDDIAWTLNLRGHDVHCNPVVVSYLIITPDEAHFFALPEKISSPVEEYLREEGVTIHPYADFYCKVATFDTYPLLLPTNSNCEISTRCLHLIAEGRCTFATSPIPAMKAIKNEAEIEGFRKAMVRDGIAMVRFLIWLEEMMEKGEEVTELSADRELTRQRSYQALFRDISFDTIAGYGTHGAIVHYEPTPESDIPLKPQGLLLLDSGAQYMDGTTDITRTIPLGPVTDDECRDYTLVLKGNIALSRAHFPHGTCGTQLDVLARQFMWADGINYLHGTGHGVGSYLNVHEGPHQFRMNHMPALLLPGMTVTNEPGIYRPGHHGVRIENMMLIVPDQETEFGTYYKFDILTLCPIDTRPIVRDMMTPDEIQWLNAYHQRVFDALAPHLEEEEQKWLKEKTKKI
ncbi:MAG: aminopeptidase P family protein [Bacteroidaceae bacterium]|nr:aminopeptidase P family protein [Bacteroidaceae bacterium]